MSLKGIWERAPKDATHYFPKIGEEYNEVFVKVVDNHVIQTWAPRDIHSTQLGVIECGDFVTWGTYYPVQQLLEYGKLLSRADYRPDNSPGYQTEGLQTVSILLDILEGRLGHSDALHASVWNGECVDHLEQATKHLSLLYQKMGEWGDG